MTIIRNKFEEWSFSLRPELKQWCTSTSCESRSHRFFLSWHFVCFFWSTFLSIFSILKKKSVARLHGPDPFSFGKPPAGHKNRLAGHFRLAEQYFGHPWSKWTYRMKGTEVVLEELVLIYINNETEMMKTAFTDQFVRKFNTVQILSF